MHLVAHKIKLSIYLNGQFHGMTKNKNKEKMLPNESVVELGSADRKLKGTASGNFGACYGSIGATFWKFEEILVLSNFIRTMPERCALELPYEARWWFI